MPLAAPRMPKGIAGDRGDSLDGVLIGIAAEVAQAGGPDEIRAALARAVGLIRQAVPALRSALCEIDAGPDGRPVIVWQAADENFGILEGGAFDAWFARARRYPGDFERVRGEKGAGILWPAGETSGWESFVGFFVSDLAVLESGQEKFAGLARIAAGAVARLRHHRAEGLRQRHLQTAQAEMLAWLELGIDLVWEAGADGVLHCRRALNRRDDLARSLEGIDLGGLMVEGGGGCSLLDLLRSEGGVRHLRVLRDGRGTGEGALYVSGRRREDESGLSFVGTLTEVRGPMRAGDEVAAAMMQMRSARRREEELRLEAETMLEGLRLLLANATSRDRLDHLTDLLARGLRASDAFIVEAGLDGRPRMLVPRGGTMERAQLLPTLARDLAAASLRVYESGDPAGEGLREAFDLDDAHVIALALPLRSQTTYFIGGTRAAHGFAAASVAFADRFALLLRQALLLREEQAQLAQTAKMAALGQMSASIAHELKQPLNTISMAAQNLEVLLGSPTFDPAAAEVKIARMMAQVDRASGVIDRMRRFGRKSVGDTGAVSLPDLAEGVVSMMRHVTEHARVDVETDIAPDLTAHIDGLQVEQVLTNLIQNAVDAISGVGTGAAAREGGRIRILGFVESGPARQAVLRVEDNGPGFPENIAERALEPFFTTKPAEQGTGLGLAICDAILRESGGFVELGNHADGGFVALHMPRAAELS